MFNFILNLIAGDYNKRQISKLMPIVDNINKICNQFESLTQDEIKNKTLEFRMALSKGENIDKILPFAFALVKQACKKMCGNEYDVKGQKMKWDMIPYDVQILGGLILHNGKIAELKTGEGKTLVATLPAYLNSLTGKGVHIVTVNDYLASRDYEWMGHLFNFLGVSVGLVTKEVPLEKRKDEYSKDITYVENSELGFDYLRDNLVKSNEHRVLISKPLNFAIIDEVDSILIDEARTPLIISRPSEDPTQKYTYYANIVKGLNPSKSRKKTPKGLLGELLSDNSKPSEDDKGDYYIDEKQKTIFLSSDGIKKLEGILGVSNLYKDLGYQEIHHIENAIKAQSVYIKDKDYIVSEGQVMIIDEHTGRSMPGRRYSEGLHQSLEAKENLNIQKESRKLATITYQNFFKIYSKLSGMTGTATTEGEEFEKIYGLEVLAVPPNKNVIRIDKQDKVYFNQNAKWENVVSVIKYYHNIGLPILIGTSSISTSEYVSSILEKIGIVHYVLNAKYFEKEALIISNAGKLGSVVVATNMAGRGTDIKLENGLNEKLATNYLKWIVNRLKGNELKNEKKVNIKAILYSEIEFNLIKKQLNDYYGLNIEKSENINLNGKKYDSQGKIGIKFKVSTGKNFNGEILIENLQDQNLEWETKEFHFGLFILGTEKHESRRIDNQLRGRAGRQGDPGISQFFVALDDDIMKKIGGEKIQSIASFLLSKEELEKIELTQKQFTNSIERAQKQMEGWNFGIRKFLFEYDNVINKQRKIIYKKRDQMMNYLDIIKNQDQNNNNIKNENLEKNGQNIDNFSNIVDELKSFIIDIINHYVDFFSSSGEVKYENIIELIKQITREEFSKQELEKITNTQDLKDFLIIKLNELFENKFKIVKKEIIEEIFVKIYLDIIDKYWIEHIDYLDYLREKVSLYGYAQLDPLIMYKKDAYEKFTNLMNLVKEETLGLIFRIDVNSINQSNIKIENLEDTQDSLILNKLEQASLKEQENLKNQKKQEINSKSNNNKLENQNNDEFEIFDINEYEKLKKNKTNEDITNIENKKIRPNDICNCGSGIKYKKCCGKNE